ncbi:MAG TPA: asparagine synthase (glutamine-hydrolyzing) [Vicinamibacterales bacterium]|nr:asparagine synthase (glutamine-hydrolyzing) [Vicinamibacterales bacterium]
MCGIAGFADPVADESRLAHDERLLRRMCAVIRHRGPDDEGIRVDGGVGLGMRRLSIIDLATGHQPIRNEDASVWVVFNGEIYNFRELRRDLERRGHRFATASDTEVIVHGYDEWGEGVFARLQGMFGIALWDRRHAVLLLARDRLGIKPLYYADLGGRLLFGSELKSLLATGEIERRLDAAALEHYLAFLYTPPDRSIIRGVRKLPPGRLLRWRGGAVRVHAYWRPPLDERPMAADEAEAALLQHLRNAVRSHLVSDVPLGAFLSGGIDSSLVVGLMAEASDRPVKTFSIGFDEPAYDELDAARLVARHFGTDHHEFIVRPDALAIVDRIVAHFDEPFGDASAIPTWYVSELARRHATVVLSGDGGDELFGGYDRYLPHPLVARFDRLPVPGAHRLAGALGRRLPRGAMGRRFLQHVAKPPIDRYIESVSFFGPEDRAALLTPSARSDEQPLPEQRLASLFARTTHLPFGSRMMHADLATYLPEDVLTKVDRMSMAHSIESRVPLLDHRLVEFALTLPLSMKIHDGERKRVLKAVGRRLLPEAILTRPKQGFAVPLAVWCRGRLRDAFADVLRSTRLRQRGCFQAREIDRLLDEHLTGRRDHELRLWQLFVFELWHRQYMDEPQRRAGTPLILVQPA